MTWDPNVDEIAVVAALDTRMPISLDEIDDGRCKASSWRGNVARPAKNPDYENHFGPGGYNRCVGPEGHRNRLHKDEWGWVFSIDEDGTNFKTIRNEMSGQ